MTSENDICLFTKKKKHEETEMKCFTVARLIHKDYRRSYLMAKCDLQIIRQPT